MFKLGCSGLGSAMHHLFQQPCPPQECSVGFCSAPPGLLLHSPILPAMPNMSTCTGSLHHAHAGSLHLVCVKPQESAQSHSALPPIFSSSVWGDNTHVQSSVLSPRVPCAVCPLHIRALQMCSAIWEGPREPDRDGGGLQYGVTLSPFLPVWGGLGAKHEVRNQN